jgi:hypothetical protein
MQSEDGDNLIEIIRISDVELRLILHEAFRLGACWSSDRRTTRYESDYLQETYAQKLNELLSRVKKQKQKTPEKERLKDVD